MEADRIANEIEKKKEKEIKELEQEKMKKMVMQNFFMPELAALELCFLVLTFVYVFHDIQLASAIIWVHVLYLKLL